VLNVFIYDPIVRAYIELRNFILVVRIAVLVALCIVLAPVIHHFGMIGAAVTAVLGDLAERLIVGTRICRTIEVTSHDFRMLSGVLRVAAVAGLAALIAYGVRTAAGTQPIFVRLAFTGTSFGLVYVAGFYFWHLPGSEIVSKERVRGYLQSTLSRLTK